MTMRETKVSALIRFLRHDVWLINPHPLPLPRRMGVYAIRLVSLVLLGFKRSQCSLHAASLTFFSLMAIVPILALMLAMARAFGGGDLAHEQFNEKLDAWMMQMEQPAVVVSPTPTTSTPAAPSDSQAFARQVRQISDKLFTQIDQLGFGTLGSIGVLMLIWTVISTLGKVETSFNQIWGAEKNRSLVRKCADYMFVAMILPFLISAASAAPVATMITGFMDKNIGGVLSTTTHWFIDSHAFSMSLTLGIGSIAFAFLLGFMPNAHVKIIPAISGGVVTMIFFSAWLRVCTVAQVGIAKYSALYGGFAVLPILLLWFYVSWQIILLGAEISFAVQNCRTYALEENAQRANMRARLALALMFCIEAARVASNKSTAAFDAETFAMHRGISHRFAMDILESLVRSGILARTEPALDGTARYVLAHAPATLTVADVTNSVMSQGLPPEAVGIDALDKSVATCINNFQQAVASTLATPLNALD